jgi:molybdate transport system ATP-binding protein
LDDNPVFGKLIAANLGAAGEFKDVLADSGVTAIFATHDRGEALGLGGRVAVLVGGGVVQVGSAEAVFSRPERADVARFVGVETLIPGRITGEAGGLVQVDCGEVQLEVEGDWEAGEEVYVAVRPEEIELHDDADHVVGPGRNVVGGRVAKTVPAETHFRVEIDGAAPVVAVVSRARYRDLALKTGQSVQASFAARAAHLIQRAGD